MLGVGREHLHHGAEAGVLRHVHGQAGGHAATTAQFQIAFSRESRQDVDAAIEAGLAAGGSEHGQAQDYGFIYTRDLEDPDGNIVAFN